MKYFYETEIVSLNDCKNDKFIASVPNYNKVVIDKIGRVVSDEYKTLEPRQDGYFEVSKDYSSVSLMDSSGKIIVSDCKEIDEFTDDGIALVTKVDGSKCWVNKEGFEFGKEFKDIGVFAGGYGVVQLDDDKWSYIDKNFKLVGVSFDKVSYFEDGYAIVKNGDEMFVIDTEFKITAGPFSGVLFRQNNLFAVHEKNLENIKTPYAYYTADGKKIGKNYVLLHGFYNGLSRVQSENGYNFIDLEGNEILKETYNMAGNFGPRFAWVCKFDEKGEYIHNFVDKQGNLLTDWYGMAGGAEDDKPYVLKGRRCYYLNEKGKPIGKGFDRLSMTSEGVAHFESSKNKYRFLFEDGEVSAEEFDYVSNFSCGVCVVKNNGVYDAINKSGHKLSSVSKRASEIEQQPITVINLIDEFADDPETLMLLCGHAIEVLDYATASDSFDDISKVQFASDKKTIETLKLKMMSQIPEKKAVTNGWEW